MSDEFDGHVSAEARDEVERKAVLNSAVGECNAQDGINVLEVTGLGTLLTEHELTEDFRRTVADIAEAWRVQQASTAAP